MNKLLEIVVFVASFILIALNYAVTGTLKLFLCIAAYLFRKASGSVSTKLSKAKQALAKHHERQELAVTTVTEPDVAEPVHEADLPFEMARIHTRTYQNGRIKVTLFQYENEIKRSAWLPVRKGKEGKVQKRFVLASLKGVTLQDAWATSREEVLALSESHRTKSQSRRPAPQPVKIESQVIEAPAEAVVESLPVNPVSKPEPVAAIGGERLARPVEWTGQLLEYGRAMREDVEQPYEAYRVRLLSEIGIEENIWGVDLARSVKESGVSAGDKVHIRFVGKRPVPASNGEGSKMHLKNIYEIFRLNTI